MDLSNAPPPFDALEATGLSQAIFVSDARSGLRAIIAIDDLTLGPAAGGIRTRRYGDVEEALLDVAGLARAMTLKCALGGLDAGGGKAVVMDHDGLDRERAFAVLGARVEDLGGLFRTAGDLGTTAADLEAMAKTTQYVHTEEVDLSAAVARGLLRCVEACCEVKGVDVEGLRVGVQGVGSIGAAVSRALADSGAELVIADIDLEAAATLAPLVNARMVSPDEILEADVDILCPCAIGGVLTESVAEKMRAWGVVPGANNALAGEAASRKLHERGVLLVPDVISSAGAVVDGIGRTVMLLEDRTLLIDRLGETAREVLGRSAEHDVPSTEVARKLARERISKVGG